MRIYNVYLNKIKTSLAKILKALRSYEVGKHNNIFLFECENIFVYLISVCRVGSAGWLQVHSTVPPGHYRCTVLYRLVTTGARYSTAWSLRPGPGWLVSVCVYVLDVPGWSVDSQSHQLYSDWLCEQTCTDRLLHQVRLLS